MREALLAVAVGCAPVPRAIVDPSRSEHFFDLPFPSDALLDAQGHPDLTGFPRSDAVPVVDAVLGGWARRLERTAVGFGNLTPAWFRFDGPVELPDHTTGAADDPVLWLSADGAERLPLDLRFVADPSGDPFLGENTLSVIPTLGHPPRPGTTYVVVVMESAGARAPHGWRAPDEVTRALDAAGVTGRPAVATTFTVQDGTSQLRALFADADARPLDVGGVTLRRVTRLRYQQAKTPSGRDATVGTVTYDDGGERVHYQSPGDFGGDVDVDVTRLPMVVWEAEIPTWLYQGLDDRPYMSPGLGTVGDVDRFTGWIDFDRSGLVSEPDPDTMRIVVALPKGEDGRARDRVPLVVHDHGTGGQAYNVVQRRHVLDRSDRLLEVLAERGWGIVGHDATLYGTRYPLIDEGYGDSLGFYNVVNLPAFRDNHRQTALDAHLLRRFLQEHLGELLPEGSIDATRLRKTGHSLGAVTTNDLLAAEPEEWESALIAGAGGDFTHYFLDTGLIENSIDPGTIAGVLALFGVDDPPEDVDPTSLLGAALGLDEGAWNHLDRAHPVMALFQWTMDPSDPMALARDETLPITVVVAPGDWQTPDFTAEALARALPDATVERCEATGDYDPHQCLWREDVGPEILGRWLDGR